MAVATNGNHHFRSDGQSVQVNLLYTVINLQPAYIEGWLGMVTHPGASGELSALSLRGEYVFEVPSGLAVAKGEIVRIDTTDLTGHTPDDTAYNKSAASATNLSFFKATMDKDGNHRVTGILMLGV